MNGLASLKSALKRVSRLGRRKGFKYHYQKVQKYNDTEKMWHRPSSSDDVILISDLRPDDVVLDMGCAEGLISIEVAKHVRQVDGVELLPERVQEAHRIAAERGVSNVSFRAGSVVDYPLAPLSYDVTLFLAVLDKVVDNGGVVGLPELERMLAATRRQIIIRYNLQRSPRARTIPLRTLLDKMNECGFDAICFGRHTLGNLIVGNRRGADARCGTVPPFVLVPSESMRDHPCIGNARVGTFDDFG